MLASLTEDAKPVLISAADGCIKKLVPLHRIIALQFHSEHFNIFANCNYHFLLFIVDMSNILFKL
jgi:hypothetical protein